MARFDPLAALRKVDGDCPYLKVGRKGWFVKLLRRCLAAHGQAPAEWLKPATEVSDDFDAELDQLVRRFQKARGISVDGEVGPQTWTALRDDAPAAGTAPVRQTALERLQSMLDSAEHRKDVRSWLRSNGGTKDGCARTASRWLNKAGVLNGVFQNTRAIENALRSKVKGLVEIKNASQLQKGDLAFSLDLGEKPMPDHVYLIQKPVNASFAIVLDNNNGIEPYKRNLKAGVSPGKTPFDYALRLPADLK